MDLKKLRSHYLKHFALILLIGHFGSVTFFFHTHDVGGQKVTHSHLYNPFSRNDSKHDHTENEILFIAALSLLLTTIYLAVGVSGATYITITGFLSVRIDLFIRTKFRFNPNGFRAPPLQ